MGVSINAHLLLDCLPEILNQMETVSHLACLWRALSGCLSIQTTSIDLDRRTLLQPCFCALDSPVFQDIDDRMTLKIDHDRPVTEEYRQLQSSMTTTRIVSFCMAPDYRASIAARSCRR